MSVAHHTLTRLDQAHHHPGAHIGSSLAHGASSFPTTDGLETIYPSLARYKPCDLTISCPNRSVSLHRNLHPLTPTTPTTPATTNLSEASKVTNISCENPSTQPPAPSSGPLHPLPDSLDALDRSALEHVARMLYADSINSRSATVQAHANAQRTWAQMDEVEQRTGLAIASLREHAKEKEAELCKQRDELESMRRRLAQVSEVLSAILPDAAENQESGGLVTTAARIRC